jgi:outer membrane protein assembly factor BamA
LERVIEKKQMKGYLKILTIFALATVSFSCSIEKRLPADQKIYGGSTLKLIETDTLKSAKIPDLEETLSEMLLPLENSKIGIPLSKYRVPYKVGFYYLIKKEKIRKWPIIRNLVEEPVFFNNSLLNRNAVRLTEYLKSRGYFDAKVLGDIETMRYQAYAKYTANPGFRYSIDSVIVNNAEGNLANDFYKSAQERNWGQFFDLEKIKTERLEIEKNLRGKGYYYFKPDNISIKADTTLKKQKVRLEIGLKEPVLPTVQRQYQINDIFVYVDSRPEIVTSKGFDFFRGLILDDPQKKYKERIFSDAIAFRPGTLYNNDLQSITNNRLIGLGNFKFINSRFEVVNRLDSTLIDVHYFLQTQKRKSLRMEANAITRSSGLAGSQLSLNWLNNNTFKGAEILKLSAKAGLELQVGGNKDNQYKDNYRIGLDAQYTIPRFWAPFIKIDPEISKVLPKTLITTGWESFRKTGLYNLNSAKATLGYAWTKGRGIEHSLRPITLNLVKSTNISTDFIDEIFTDPRLLVILENQFIAGGSYEINVRQRKLGKGLFSYNGNLDLAGNLFGLYDKIRNNPEKKGKVFGDYFSQFVRLEQDLRYKIDISRKTSWANRAIVGVGVPYGNSLQLPFVNQFYVGGNNSLRAFRARGVGPGTYARTGSLAEQFLGNNTGDVKLELNTELRYKVNNFVGTALFVDAGNVWMAKDEYIYGPGVLFSKSFLNEMAIGGGIGFRFDFSFVIFRLDIATPFRKPWLGGKERWVIDDFSLKKDYRKENLIWNIAVGLPF